MSLELKQYNINYYYIIEKCVFGDLYKINIPSGISEEKNMLVIIT